MNQPNQQNPNKGMPDKQQQQNPSRTGQQTQQGNRPSQGGYTSPGQGSHGQQSAPGQKK
ncbi:hypothetical protein [Edaphobacter albus]|uniref:hypothetical protein n=1 Tax=Edaphobacter sp. 4G125 TaxID=2763071 RepID=UPI001645DEED|nr:hypothetical protein [Edaphobacter sp. 4G125]QNI37026.1 hypothetical protein H7846_01405 [Edaphobacter sp. 4G125]